MNLLTFVGFIALVLTVYADDLKEVEDELNKVVAECRTKFKISDEDLVKLKNDEITNPDENMQCLINCVMATVGIIKNGLVQPDAAIAMLNKRVGEEKAKTVIENCRAESGKSDCETAYKLHKCLVKNKAY